MLRYMLENLDKQNTKFLWRNFSNIRNDIFFKNEQEFNIAK